MTGKGEIRYTPTEGVGVQNLIVSPGIRQMGEGPPHPSPVGDERPKLLDMLRYALRARHCSHRTDAIRHSYRKEKVQ